MAYNNGVTLARKKDKNESEHLRGEIRELEKQNKQLRRRLTKYEKSKHIYNDLISDYEEIISEHVIIEKIVPKSKATRCPSCHEGAMEEYEIMGKVIGTCNSCGHRKRVK